MNPLHLVILLAYLALVIWGLVALWRSRIFSTLEKVLLSIGIVVLPFFGLIILLITVIVVGRARKRSITD